MGQLGQLELDSRRYPASGTELHEQVRQPRQMPDGEPLFDLEPELAAFGKGSLALDQYAYPLDSGVRIVIPGHG